MCCAFFVDHKHAFNFEFKIACISFSVALASQQCVMHNNYCILNTTYLFFRGPPIAKHCSTKDRIPRCHDNVEVPFHFVANRTGKTSEISKHIVVDFLVDGAGGDECNTLVCRTHDSELDYAAALHNVVDDQIQDPIQFVYRFGLCRENHIDMLCDCFFRPTNMAALKCNFCIYSFVFFSRHVHAPPVCIAFNNGPFQKYLFNINGLHEFSHHAVHK
mmetsp:Transcript_132895/g.234195  ORF Transcript_132895/g.234195 Transcript_132895/m.234195 type:complete len:217 (+) Transcript_132895:2954-3604(+)